MSISVHDVISKVTYSPRYTIMGHIGSYHRDSYEYHYPGHHEMERFESPTLPKDLNEGFNDKDEIDNTEPSIIPLLKGIQESSLLSINVHFITYRNNLNKILNTPYNLRNGWKIRLQRLNHPFFGHAICLHVVHNNENQNEKQKRMSHWGRQFEVFCTSTPSVTEGIKKEYCTIVLSQLDRFRLVVGAEIDCHNTPDNTQLHPNHFIELKTNRILDSQKIENSFNQHKLRSSWIQSMLAGVPTIYFGFRNDDGIIQHCKTYKTNEIPGYCSLKNARWDASICMRFGSSLLNFIYENVRNHDFYELEYYSISQRITLSKTTENIFSLSELDNMESISSDNCNCNRYSFN